MECMLMCGRQYWKSEREFEANKPASGSGLVDLSSGYEVLVDMDDPRWSFTLQPRTEDGRRSWHFRAHDESSRHAWSKCLVLNTLLSND